MSLLEYDVIPRGKKSPRGKHKLSRLVGGKGEVKAHYSEWLPDARCCDLRVGQFCFWVLI